MIKLFDIEDGQLAVTEHCYALPFLKELMDYFPNCYIKVYRYIFYMTCPDDQLNPCRNIPEHEKSTEIMRLLEVDTEKEFIADDLKIEKAVKECAKLYDDPAMRVYRAAKMMLEKLQGSFEAEELTWGGKDATGPALTSAMEKLPKLLQAYNDAELKMNEVLKARSRGGQNISDDIDELED